MQMLFIGMLIFVGGHFLLSSGAIRPVLQNKLGANGFKGLYSVVAIASLILAVKGYMVAPYVEVWAEPKGLRHLLFLLMPIALFFVISGSGTPNPLAVGGEKVAESDHPVSGILTITRHPVMWGVSLWAAGHLIVNGDQASIILFGGMLVLAQVGMVLQDRRKVSELGAAWGPIQLTTSMVPFVAVLQGRTKIDWRGIGWVKPAIAIGATLALAYAHPWFAGVPIVG